MRGSQKLHISKTFQIFRLDQHLHSRSWSRPTFYIRTWENSIWSRNVQYLVPLRSSSPDHNGNASVVDKMPPLPPWLTRSATYPEDCSDKPLSQSSASPRPRHQSDGSNGKIWLKIFLFSPLQMVQQVPLFLGLIQFSDNLVLTPLWTELIRYFCDGLTIGTKVQGKGIKYLDNVWESVGIVISDDVMIFYEFHHSSTKFYQEFWPEDQTPSFITRLFLYA